MTKKSLLIICLSILSIVSCQEAKSPENATVRATKTHEVSKIVYSPDSTQEVKNIIFLVGDGMGITQVYAGMTANHGKLFIENMPVMGMSKTYSSDKYITDSASGATAFSAGKKTYNGAIGVGPDGKPIETILEIAEKNGLATGLVATSSITHATPASFIAHQPKRSMEEEIAADFLKTDIDVFIGGGKKFFADREDGKDLTVELKDKGYQVVYSMEDLAPIKSGKVAALTAENENPPYSHGREDMLPNAAEKAIELLSQSEKGFFLMVEGSQIDWGGHKNDIQYVVDEMLDFDRTIAKALEFAAKDKHTLVVVTADHETGGLTLNGGSIEKGEVNAMFTTGSHTAVSVPVFAFGPQAEQFSGYFENTAIFDKFLNAYQFQNQQ
ncbi:MAG: alkaline phosphatase [Thalassobius sp.]|nr:alkaline phosphatase [Thalassovita sp.]